MVTLKELQCSCAVMGEPDRKLDSCDTPTMRCVIYHSDPRSLKLVVGRSGGLWLQSGHKGQIDGELDRDGLYFCQILPSLHRNSEALLQ